MYIYTYIALSVSLCLFSLSRACAREGGGLRVEVGGWRVEGGGWRVEGGGWSVFINAVLQPILASRRFHLASLALNISTLNVHA